MRPTKSITGDRGQHDRARGRGTARRWRYRDSNSGSHRDGELIWHQVDLYDNLVAAGKVPDCATEDLFAVAERITVGGVEEVDAGFERLLDEGFALLLAERPGVIAPVAAAIAHAAEADARHVQAGAAELHVNPWLTRAAWR